MLNGDRVNCILSTVDSLLQARGSLYIAGQKVLLLTWDTHQILLRS